MSRPTRKGIPVDRIKARKEVKNRHYIPIKDNDVMEYIRDRVKLLRASNRTTLDEELVEAI